MEAAVAPRAEFGRRPAHHRHGDAVAITLAFAVVMSRPSPSAGSEPARSSTPSPPASASQLAIRSRACGTPQDRHPLGRAGRPGQGRRLILAGVLLADRVSACHCGCAGSSRGRHDVACPGRLAIDVPLVAGDEPRGAVCPAPRSSSGPACGPSEIVRMAEVHPEAGTRVIGIVGSRSRPRPPGAATCGSARSTTWPRSSRQPGPPHRHQLHDIAPAAARRADPGRARRRRRGDRPRRSVRRRPHRLTVSAIANEAVLHVESATPSLLALALKRPFDIVVAGAMLLVASPVLAAIAILVKREDRGPVLFRQQPSRAGRRRVRDAQVPHDVRRRRGPAGGHAGRQPAHRPAVQDGP